MTLPNPISASQTDAKSPVDQQLMDSIRLDLEALDAAQATNGVFDYQWKADGYLSLIPTASRIRLGGPLIGKSQTFSKCQISLGRPGLGGNMEVDVRVYTKPDAIIKSIQRTFNSAISSIGIVGTGISTQSITRASAQITTQSITQFVANANVQSITSLGGNLFRYNLDVQPNATWVVGDSVTIASATNTNNNGTFVIVRINDDNGNNVIISNTMGAAQNTVNGTVTLCAWAYNYTSAILADYAAGEPVTMTSHTNTANNGNFTIFATNQSGNNIIVKNPTGATQGSSAGTADTNRWVFAYSSAVLTPDYTVGEKINASGHTSGGNNGLFTIIAVNRSGNNLIISNGSGVVQGSAAGTVNTNRWAYIFATDPGLSVNSGEFVEILGATTTANNGEFVIKEVDDRGGDNIVVYNESGAAQGGAFGTLVSRRMIISFFADLSATITTSSRITLFNTSMLATDGDFLVTQVNRGGGSNFNAVIDAATGIEQLGAGGRVVLESKSIFNVKPIITIAPRADDFHLTHYQVAQSTNMNSNATVALGALIMFDITQIPTGDCKDLLVQLV